MRALVLSLSMVLAAAPAGFSEGYVPHRPVLSGWWTYSVPAFPLPHRATILGYHGPGGAIAIPSEIDGYPVNRVESIHNSNGPSSVTSVVIPNSVISIGDRAFSGWAGLTSVAIPNSVTSIGISAFSGCTSLSSVIIPDSVTSIGNSAFSGCTRLTSVTIPNSVTSIGSSAFSGCTSLSSVTIPDGVTSIGPSTFFQCASLTSVTIPDSVTSIGDSAFSGCAGLTSVTIPTSVTSIGRWAFSGCAALTNATIPDSVTSIGDGAFQDCTSLTSVTIPESVRMMGDDVFYRCTGLISATINTGLPGFRSFLDCTSLTKVTLGPGVLDINTSVFKGCSALREAEFLGDKPLTLKSNVFDEAAPDFRIIYHGKGFEDWLADPVYPATSIPLTDWDYIVDASNEATIRSYRGPGGAVMIPAVIDGFAVKQVGDGEFPIFGDRNRTVNSVTIPDGVTSIRPRAFYHCYSLTSVAIPDSVTSIEEFAFSGCEGLTSVVIPDSVTRIGRAAFQGTYGLTSVAIPASVTRIEEFAFAASGLTNVVIPHGVTSIGRWAFLGADLTSIIIPDSVTSIEYSAFEACDRLTQAEFLGNAPAMEPRVFDLASPDFQIIYHGSGYSSPTWMGYPAFAASKPPATPDSPTLTVAAPSEVSVVTRSPRYTLRGTARDNVRPTVLQYRLQRPGGKYGAWLSGTLSGKGKNRTWSQAIDLPHAGVWRVQLRVADAAGNRSAAVVRTIVVDRDRPSLVVTSPQGRAVWAKEIRYTLRGTASDNVTPVRLDIRVQRPGEVFGAWQQFDLSGSKKSKSWWRNVRLNALGEWRVQVRVADRAGNVSVVRTITMNRQ